jgi:hypothetical protein
MGQAILLLALAALAACTSPEATRQRAGGSGADVGNRGRVELHEGSRPYAGTPTVLPRAHEGRGEVAAASPRGR